MLNDEQRRYIDNLRTNYAGIEDAALRKILETASWSPEHIDDALIQYKGGETPPPPPPPEVVAPVVNSSPIAAVGSTPMPYREAETTAPVMTETPVRQSRIPKIAIIAAAVLVLLSAIGAGAYFVLMKSSFFGPPALTSENVLEHVVTKLGEIETTEYALTFKLWVSDRDEGAKSLSDTAPTSADELAKYQRDQDRFRDATAIQDALQTYFSAKMAYPAKLSDTTFKGKDPLGKAYKYVRAADGKDYELSVTFETAEAYAAASRSSMYTGGNAEEPDPAEKASKTITVGKDDYIYAYDFTGEPTQPKLFGLFALSEIEEMLPSNIEAMFTLGGTVDNSTEKTVDGRLTVSGEATFDDASFAFDAEGMKKGETYYGIIRKIPALFSSVSQIKDKWVAFTEEELRNYGYTGYIDEFVPSDENERKEDLEGKRAQLRKLIELANKHGLVNVTAGPTKEKVEKATREKYVLTLKRDSILPFYEEATETVSSYGEDSLLKRDEKTVEYLKSEEFSSVFDYITENVTFNLWIDEAGFPARFEIVTRYVPSEKARAMKGKQINLSFGFDLTGINAPLAIEAPKEFVSLDDFMVDLTGLTKEEIVSQRQQSNIMVLRNALDSFHSWTGRYPTTLEELEKLRKDFDRVVTESDEYMYFNDDYYKDMPFIKQVPFDVYTKKQYGYKTAADDYQLIYQMKLIKYESGKNPANYYTYPPYDYTNPNWEESQILLPKFVEGENIATKDRLSQAESQTADDDKDGVTNAVEKILGTDPKKADTDGDGFDDKDEITTGSNPKGPGRLEYDYGYGYW